MTDTTSSAGLGRPLLIFTFWLVLLQGIIIGIETLIPDFTLPGALNVVVLYFASYFGGRSFGKAAGRAMTGGEGFRFGLVALAVSLAIGAVVITLLFRQAGVPLTMDNLQLVLAQGERDLVPWLWPILAVATVITVAVAAGGAVAGAKRATRDLAGSPG